MSCGPTPAIANARGAASVSPMWKRSGRLAMSSAGAGWPSAPPSSATGGLREVARALERRDHHGRRAVGLEAAVEEAERLRHPRRREVLVHRERAVAHHRLLVVVRVLAAGERDRAGIGGQGSVELLMTGGDPAVELRRGARAVGKVEVDEGVGDRAAVDATPRAPHAGTVAEGRVAVPTDHDEHRVRRHPRRRPWPRARCPRTSSRHPCARSTSNGRRVRRGWLRAPRRSCTRGAGRCRRCRRR